MTRFTDGPAAGQSLTLERHPQFLRVVYGPGGLDALDQLDDEPTSVETLTVYRLVDRNGSYHIHSRDKKTGRYTGRWHRMATYALHPRQPEQETMRKTASWRAWGESEIEIEMPNHQEVV